MSRRRVLLLRLDPLGGEGPYLFSSDHVAFAPAWLPSGAAAQARISGQDDIVIERHASVWMFDRSPVQKAGVVALLNGDRALDALLSISWRDAAFDLRWCWDDEAADPSVDWDDCRIWQAGVVDSMHTTAGDRTIVLTLADPLARFDVSLQSQMYPDSFANAAVRGKPRPVCLGVVPFAPGVLRDTASSGADAYSYDLHDGPVDSVSAAYDRGDLFTFITDWNYIPARTGVKLVNAPDNPVSFSVVGETLPSGSATTWDFAGGSWGPTAPTDWNVATSGGATLTHVAGGARLLIPPGGGLGLATDANVLAANTSYRVTAVVSARTKGEVTLRALFTIQQPPIASAQVHEWIIGESASARSLRIYHVAGVDTDLTIESITLTPVVSTAFLPEFFRAVAERADPGIYARGGVNESAISALSVGLDKYALGLYADEPVTAISVLRQALDAWSGWVSATRDGRLTVGRIGVRGGRGSIRLGRGQVISVQRRQDTAPGLSTRMAGLRNYRVHGDGEIAGSVSGELRAELREEYQINVTSAVMPAAYRHAEGAPPRPTLIQQTINSVGRAAGYAGTLFAQGPFTWYEVECAISSEIADGLELGDWLHVTHPVAGLDAGKWLCLMGVSIGFFRRRATLVLIDFPES